MIYWTWTWETLRTRTTSLDLDWFLLNTGVELINQPNRDVVTKVWRLSWINCFLHFNIVLIHAAFTAPSFGNLYDDISIQITTLFMQLWMLHVIFTYVNNTYRMFSHFLVSWIMSKRIVQIQSRSTSLGQILCGLKNQMLMLLSSTVKYIFRIQKQLSWSKSNQIPFICISINNKSKSVCKIVVQCRS